VDQGIRDAASLAGGPAARAGKRVTRGAADMARETKGRRTRTIGAFLHVSLDGYYCDADGDMSFVHKAPTDSEWNEFVTENASGNAVLLFGRVTYDMMAAWWPSPMAAKAMPSVAAAMNARPKVVFSKTIASAEWAHTDVAGDLIGWARQAKLEDGPDMVVLGSGTIVTQLAAAGLLDSLQVVVNPVALGAGRPMFGGLATPIHFPLLKTRTFENGAVVLWYGPSAQGRMPMV
jgi:dihydrofolate reductase